MQETREKPEKASQDKTEIKLSGLPSTKSILEHVERDIEESFVHFKKQEELNHLLAEENSSTVSNEDDEKLASDLKKQYDYEMSSTYFRKKPKKENEEDEEEKQQEIEQIVIVAKLDENRKVLAYSIGHNETSDIFHDISHLNMDYDDFTSEVDGILNSSAREGMSVSEGIQAVTDKFPGSKTYFEKASWSLDDQLSKSLDSLFKKDSDKAEKEEETTTCGLN